MSWAMIGAAGITAAGSIAGGMMSKGGGDTEYIPLTREQRTARAYWRDELAKIQGLQSGNTAPWETPEFKSIANRVNTQGNQQISNTLNQLGQRGITGGAAAGYLNNAQSGINSNLLNVIQSIYQKMNQRGDMVAQQLNASCLVPQPSPQMPQGGSPDMTGLFGALFSMLNKDKTGGAGGGSSDYTKYLSTPQGNTFGNWGDYLKNG